MIVGHDSSVEKANGAVYLEEHGAEVPNAGFGVPRSFDEDFGGAESDGLDGFG